ncbi:hypothetical protein BDN67DRAFT_985896 [Paxillus ammoniavirescens]|nr:hypothetical protein BDN67DRAFT_985896 [Paxillus ammoniavirescens]
MADTPFLRLSKSLFQVVQTWLHCRGAAIEAALACPVLESQKAKFAELLMAEGCQISTFIAAYPNSNNLSIDPSLAKLILQCQASQSALAVLTLMSDSSWAEKPKARPSDVSHVPLPATQQWWRPFHEATRKQVFLSPTAGVKLSDTDHFQYLQKTHKDLREWLIFADSELRRNSDKVHTMLAAQVSKRDTLQRRLELYQVTVNLLKERNADLQERAENSEALAAVQREELQDLRCQLAELELLSIGAPMPDISYPEQQIVKDVLFASNLKMFLWPDVLTVKSASAEFVPSSADEDSDSAAKVVQTKQLVVQPTRGNSVTGKLASENIGEGYSVYDPKEPHKKIGEVIKVKPCQPGEIDSQRSTPAPKLTQKQFGELGEAITSLEAQSVVLVE